MGCVGSSPCLVTKLIPRAEEPQSPLTEVRLYPLSSLAASCRHTCALRLISSGEAEGPSEQEMGTNRQYCGWALWGMSADGSPPIVSGGMQSFP